ncbi:trypsin-like peptidase domain-containing protein [Streptosporangiaceae bacterium NEAU-GS5]|nr:trypsin-like peptidase domain-containing protein [Streptosporangiaceae bacterium NEAU-GS5]
MGREPEGLIAANEEPTAAAGVPRRVLVTGSAVVAALVVVIGVLAFRLGGVTATASAPSPSASPRPSVSPSPTVPELYKRVGPSVVVIQTEDGLGTGVIVGEDGTILTAHHVIAGAKKINLTFADGTKAQATVASDNPERDIAALKPGGLPEILQPAILGGGLEVGAPVVAIGNPLGLTFSVSSGVVSGLDRRSETDHGDLSGLIQFDASVNPGSSGGPLLDDQGLVVGIVVSIADPGRDDAFAGIAFAVPIGAALSGGDGAGDANGPQI